MMDNEIMRQQANERLQSGQNTPVIKERKPTMQQKLAMKRHLDSIERQRVHGYKYTMTSEGMYQCTACNIQFVTERGMISHFGLRHLDSLYGTQEVLTGNGERMTIGQFRAFVTIKKLA